MEIEAEAAETGHRTGRRTTRKSAHDGVVEVVTRGERRRSWSADQKRRIVVEAMQPGATPTEVIRRWGLTSSLFYTWRRQVMGGELGAVPTPLAPAAFAQVTVAGDAPAPAPVPETSARAPARIEVVLPDGTVLRLDEDVGADALRRVIAVLRGR